MKSRSPRKKRKSHKKAGIKQSKQALDLGEKRSGHPSITATVGSRRGKKGGAEAS